MKNPYAVLVLPKDADAAAIKRAYRDLAKRTHPDVGGTREAFEEATAAYELLSDPERRARYDASGETGEPQVDMTLAQAMALVNNFVLQVAPQDFAETIDLVDAVRRLVLEQRRGLVDGAAAARKHADKAEGLAKRFKRKEGENFIAAVLDQTAAQARASADAREQAIKVQDAALKLLDGFTFDFIKPEPPKPVFVDPSYTVGYDQAARQQADSERQRNLMSGSAMPKGFKWRIGL